MKTTALATTLILVGILIVLRAVIIVASGENGRFRADPWITVVLGFALLLLGQLLIS